MLGTISTQISESFDIYNFRADTGPVCTVRIYVQYVRVHRSNENTCCSCPYNQRQPTGALKGQSHEIFRVFLQQSSTDQNQERRR